MHGFAARGEEVEGGFVVGAIRINSGMWECLVRHSDKLLPTGDLAYVTAPG